MATISLAMIVKNEGSTIERVLGCARAFCDEMIVVDTGSTDDTVAKAQASGAKIHHFKWIEDFSAARNFSFSKCTQDWIMWLDGDDIIQPESQQLIRELKTTTLNNTLEAVYVRYLCPPFLQWRERIVRRDIFGKKLEWREPIHECIYGIDDQKTKYFDSIFIQHDTPPDRHELKKDRNINILRKQHQSGTNNDRTTYMYAVECLHSLYREEGEQVLEKFFATVKYSPYRYEIYSKMYDFYMHFGEPQLALDAVYKAIGEDPARAEAYYKIGRHLSNKNDQPTGAIPLLTTASLISVPSYGMPETEAYTHGPWEALCRANFRLEKYNAAKEAAKKAIQHQSPQEKWLAELVAYDTAGFPTEALPPQWQEWTDTNLKSGVPRWQVIRILEDSHFTPGQIITGVRLYDQKQAAR